MKQLLGFSSKISIEIFSVKGFTTDCNLISLTFKQFNAKILNDIPNLIALIKNLRRVNIEINRGSNANTHAGLY